MKTNEMRQYEELLKKELVPALGCTEPGAVGYAAAKAADVLGVFPEHMEMYCSANIIKNVKSVNVPNSGGMKGIEAAAVLGMLSGDPDDGLEIFKNATSEEIERTKTLISEGFCKVHLQEGEGNLYINAEVYAKGDDIKIRAKAKAAAGSDARMGGSSLPVVINSGSGNQGITLTVPVVVYAKELGVSDDVLYRAMAISNLISIHIKKNFGIVGREGMRETDTTIMNLMIGC